MSGRPFAEFSRDEFTRMWLDGAKIETMADVFGCTISTISDRARRFGLPHRERGGRRRDYTDLVPLLEQRWAEGVPVRSIARELAISVKTLTRLTRHLAPRPPGRSKRPASSAVSAS